jgi:hypothetical protein
MFFSASCAHLIDMGPATLPTAKITIFPDRIDFAVRRYFPHSPFSTGSVHLTTCFTLNEEPGEPFEWTSSKLASSSAQVPIDMLSIDRRQTILLFQSG